MIDPALVTRHIAVITNNVRDLTAIVTTAPDPMATVSGRHQLRAERLLERIVARMIEINAQVIADQGQPAPQDDYASFVQLGSIGILTEEFARRIAACAELRSGIVHAYTDLAPDEVQAGLQAAVAGVPVYLRAMPEYLETRPRG